MTTVIKSKNNAMRNNLNMSKKDIMYIQINIGQLLVIVTNKIYLMRKKLQTIGVVNYNVKIEDNS
jgi:hypothetical protein